MFSLSRSKRFPQKILASPAIGAREIKFAGRDCFELITMRGDWIKVRQADHCENSGWDTMFYSGWLRWRRGNQILIDYLITS